MKVLDFSKVKNMCKDDIESAGEILGEGQIERR